MKHFITVFFLFSGSTLVVLRADWGVFSFKNGGFFCYAPGVVSPKKIGGGATKRYGACVGGGGSSL